jgi:hypothetical protein
MGDGGTGLCAQRWAGGRSRARSTVVAHAMMMRGSSNSRGRLGPATWAAGTRCRGSQVGFIWAQGLGHRGKAACRSSRLEWGLDSWIFIERNALAWRDRYAKEKGTIV